MNIIYVSGPRGSGVTSALDAIVSTENLYLALAPDDIIGISTGKQVVFSLPSMAIDLGSYSIDSFANDYKDFIEAAKSHWVTHLYVGFNTTDK